MLFTDVGNGILFETKAKSIVLAQESSSEDETFYLVVIKSEEFQNSLMILVANMKPENDEFTKIVLLTIVIGFIAMFSDNQKQIQYMVVFEASESLRKNEEIVLVFYAVERGMKKIFGFNLNGIKNKKEKGRKAKDMQLSLF